MSTSEPAARYCYPALIACIAQGRDPARHELKRVAARILDEAYPALDLPAAAKFRLYRKLWHAAHVALGGSSQTAG